MKKITLFYVVLLLTVTFCFAQTEEKVINDAWKNYRIYLGLRSGIGFNLDPGFEFSAPVSNKVYNINCSEFLGIGAAYIAVQLADFIAIQGEAIYNNHYLSAHPRDASFSREEYVARFNYNSLIIPVMTKFTFRPGIFNMAGLAGIYFNIPLGDATVTAPTGSVDKDIGDIIIKSKIELSPGFMAGINLGIGGGTGGVFLDLRYMYDFKETSIKSINFMDIDVELGAFNKLFTDVFARSKFLLTIGYEFGFGNRNNTRSTNKNAVAQNSNTAKSAGGTNNGGAE
ncbi:MAG: hypothetical protein LBH20_03605 [Treponema sp.]|jgi:hypothetical protein|nr:hypothetical protein [Treponema sp.]